MKKGGSVVRKKYERHGYATRGNPDKVYKAWDNLKTRVQCKRHRSHIYYKHLEIEQDFLDDFMCFYAEVGDPPSDKHTIERRDNTKGYIYGNIKWSTWKEQAANRRKKGTVVKATSKVIDLTGQQCGRWFVISYAYSKPDAYFWCKCKCNTLRLVLGKSLRNGRSKSCGCWKLESLKMKRKKV